jgi:hypothetical protein
LYYGGDPHALHRVFVRAILAFEVEYKRLVEDLRQLLTAEVRYASAVLDLRRVVGLGSVVHT